MKELTKKQRIQKYGDVFTPPHIVEQMLDALPKDAFEPSKTYLEPACGEGVFTVAVLRRKFERCKAKAEYSAALASVYSMDIQERNVDATIEAVTELCKEYFNPSKADLEVIKDHVILCDSLKIMKMMNDERLKEG